VADEKSAEIITGRAVYADTVARLFGQAVSRLDLYSVDLNRDLYATPECITALREWLTRQPRAQVRILVHRGQTAMLRGNALVELGLKLTSYVSFRDPAPTQPLMGDMLIIDGRTLLKKPTPDSMQAELHHDPLAAKLALKEFDEYWNSGEPSQQIRNLHL